MSDKVIMKKNKYGNVDIRNGVPDGFAHIPRSVCGCRNIHAICRHKNIPCGTAFVGFDTGDGPWVPILDGVVVPAKDCAFVIDEIVRRNRADNERWRRKREKEAARASTQHDSGPGGCQTASAKEDGGTETPSV